MPDDSVNIQEHPTVSEIRFAFRFKFMLLLFSLLLMIPLQPIIAQSANDDEAILYMSYEDTAEGVVLIVSPDGYRAIPIDRSWFASDVYGRYQRDQMIASDDGRWLVMSIRDTVEDEIFWMPVVPLGDSGSPFVPMPMQTTRAVKLGSFSPDGRYLSLAVVGQESPDAPLMGGLYVFDLTSDVESDELAQWWLPLELHDGQVMWAEIGEWTTEGIQFLVTCYECDDRPVGEYALWEPFADVVTEESGVYFVPNVTVLKSTGEAVRLEYDAAFPLNSGVTGANVIRYLLAATPDGTDMTTIYTDPRGIDWAQWVLDGQALLVQPSGVQDAWVLVYRNGEVVDYPHVLGIRFVVGSTQGWFVEGGNADGYTDIAHMRLDGSDYLASAEGGATVIRPPNLGRNLIDPLPFQPIEP